ncbi:MAG: restriction endonuclease [Desulfovibrionaceae bacterium]|nr:restriction endonuclease [Desulfovibrionaceae bacterium]
MKNALYFGDCLDVLRNLSYESVDLIYLDPPFNSKADYNILYKNPAGDKSKSQIEVFQDTWHWNEQSEQEFTNILKQKNTDVSALLTAMRSFLGVNDMMAYLVMMTGRLLELYRILKPTGSLYLHCDPTASHYLKIVMDSVFGKENYKNCISWKRSGRRSSISKSYRRAHDELLFYKRSDSFYFNIQYEEFDETLLKAYNKCDARGDYQSVPLMASGIRKGETGQIWRGYDPNIRGRSGMHWLTTHDKLEKYVKQGLVEFPTKENGVPRLKYYLDQNKGIPLSDFWDDISLIHSMGSESLGYPTQKPLALLERIIQASSNEGDIVLDPFCGCGTAVHAAQKLNRRWIGIDITHLAISLIEKRLRDAFPDVQYDVHGTPKDIEGAYDLAMRGKYQFEWWACSLVNAQPYKDKKKGADGGIDGIIYFQDEHNAQPKKIIVSVKGGKNIDVKMIRELAHVIDKEKAEIGLFVALEKPTKPMKTEAIAKGLYSCPHNGKQYPKIQILTIRGLLEGTERPEYTDLQSGSLTFKKAERAKIAGPSQATLL